MGHSAQAVSVLVRAASSVLAVPLDVKIHEGTVFTDEEPRPTLLDKLLSMITALDLAEPYYLVADAYYASGKLIAGLGESGNHLVTRARKSVVGYHRPAPVLGKRKRGRPRLYGDAIKLLDLFDSERGSFVSMTSPVYDERELRIRVLVRDLLWRPSGPERLVRFVLVEHPERGRLMLICTDTSLGAREIVRLYGLRFKIELSFKQAAHVIGTYHYRFWMQEMDRIARYGGDQDLRERSVTYRRHVWRKLEAYHVFLFMGVVAQGLMQYLAACHTEQVWRSFGSWLRTVRRGVAPSEFVVREALRHTLGEFLLNGHGSDTLAKFIVQNQRRYRSSS